MAYINDGNLYFQKGSNPPQQLTHSGEDRNILFFSENGEKIFFRRDTTPPFELHSINIDGSEERALITNKLLRTMDTSYTDLTGFHHETIVPNTHLILFSTYEPRDNNSVLWNGDLLVVDTDTAKIRKLPFHASDFFLSPDGKYIVRDRIGAIDVLGLEGNTIYKNMVTYTPSEPSFLPPGILWTPDSKGLIILLPVRTNFDLGYISEFTTWHYTLNDGKGTQIPLDIHPTEGKPGMVSPDGKRILYNNNDEHYGFYIGNLSTGHAEVYDPEGYVSYSWNSDSKHFIYELPNSILYLGSVESIPELIGRGEFLGWIDSNRYLYYADKNIVLGNINGSKEIILVNHESFQSNAFFSFILP
jgi:Tol biopolymer transport system component